MDSTDTKYPICGDGNKDLLIGRLWCEGAKGYIALYFANYDALKFRIRRQGTHMKLKLWHRATGLPIYYSAYNRTIIELILEGKILKGFD